jgi:hypothetical protein
MAKTTYQMACEISNELGLSLSNGQVDALASFLGGFEDPEGEQRAIFAGGRAAAAERGFARARSQTELADRAS